MMSDLSPQMTASPGISKSSKIDQYWEGHFSKLGANGGGGSPSAVEDWFVASSVLVDHLLEHVPALRPGAPGDVMLVGCGTSPLSTALWSATKPRTIISTDISPTAVAAQQAWFPESEHPGLRFAVGDCLNLSGQYPRGSFAVVVDKCCADTFLFRSRGMNRFELVSRMWSEMAQVLEAGGIYVWITPRPRVPWLRGAPKGTKWEGKWSWNVKTVAVQVEAGSTVSPAEMNRGSTDGDGDGGDVKNVEDDEKEAGEGGLLKLAAAAAPLGGEGERETVRTTAPDGATSAAGKPTTPLLLGARARQRERAFLHICTKVSGEDKALAGRDKVAHDIVIRRRTREQLASGAAERCRAARSTWQRGGERDRSGGAFWPGAVDAADFADAYGPDSEWWKERVGTAGLPAVAASPAAAAVLAVSGVEAAALPASDAREEQIAVWVVGRVTARRIASKRLVFYSLISCEASEEEFAKTQGGRIGSKGEGVVDVKPRVDAQTFFEAVRWDPPPPPPRTPPPPTLATKAAGTAAAAAAVSAAAAGAAAAAAPPPTDSEAPTPQLAFRRHHTLVRCGDIVAVRGYPGYSLSGQFSLLGSRIELIEALPTDTWGIREGKA